MFRSTIAVMALAALTTLAGCAGTAVAGTASPSSLTSSSATTADGPPPSGETIYLDVMRQQSFTNDLTDTELQTLDNGVRTLHEGQPGARSRLTQSAIAMDMVNGHGVEPYAAGYLVGAAGNSLRPANYQRPGKYTMWGAHTFTRIFRPN